MGGTILSRLRAWGRLPHTPWNPYTAGVGMPPALRPLAEGAYPHPPKPARMATCPHGRYGPPRRPQRARWLWERGRYPGELFPQGPEPCPAPAIGGPLPPDRSSRGRLHHSPARVAFARTEAKKGREGTVAGATLERTPPRMGTQKGGSRGSPSSPRRLGPRETRYKPRRGPQTPAAVCSYPRFLHGLCMDPARTMQPGDGGEVQ